jgi:hypothetical protein
MMLGGSSALEVRKGKGQDGGSMVERTAQANTKKKAQEKPSY